MNLNRRDFIKKNTIAGLGLAVAPSILRTNLPANGKVRLGFIGMGGRGTWLLRLALSRDDVEEILAGKNPKYSQVAQNLSDSL